MSSFSVCDLRVTPDFTSKIVRTLAIEPSFDGKGRSRLVPRYVRIGKPPLESQEDIEYYLLALCEYPNILDAWLYQQTFSEDLAGYNEFKEAHDDPPPPQSPSSCSSTEIDGNLSVHIIRTLSRSLVHVTPPGTPKAATEGALTLLQDFIHVLLIHEGHHGEAIGLDCQFANSPFNIAGGLVREGLDSRRLGVKELVSVLLKVQRKLVDVQLEQREQEEVTVGFDRRLRALRFDRTIWQCSGRKMPPLPGYENARNGALQAFASWSSEGWSATEGSATPTLHVGSLPAVGASSKSIAPFGI
ncbi:hypothetical protein FRC00_004633 [Tulasnella sp. 408]|nr:hypothetical protein FRC00_004633 [Tulasnella sp. 408]